MKHLILSLILALYLAGCSKDIPTVTLEPKYGYNKLNGNFMWWFDMPKEYNVKGNIRFTYKIGFKTVQVQYENTYEMLIKRETDVKVFQNGYLQRVDMTYDINVSDYKIAVSSLKFVKPD